MNKTGIAAGGALVLLLLIIIISFANTFSEIIPPSLVYLAIVVVHVLVSAIMFCIKKIENKLNKMHEKLKPTILKTYRALPSITSQNPT
jgi:cobalamin biosynthesis protein CobD/CbiB